MITARRQTRLRLSDTYTPYQSAVPASVSNVMCAGIGPICFPALNTQVFPSRACQPPTGRPWRLVDVTAEHQVGTVLADPIGQILVGERTPTVVAQRRTRRWCVVEPDPALRSVGRRRGQLTPYLVAGGRSVPPGAYREPGLSDVDRGAVHVQRLAVQPAQPRGHLFAVRSRAVEVVVAGGGEDQGPVREEVQIVADDQGLHRMRHRAGHIGKVPDESNGVHAGAGLDQPVEVRQPIVQVRQGPGSA